MRISVINGANLNLLGTREEEHYGNFTLNDLQHYIQNNLPNNVECIFFQSNEEASLIEHIHETTSNRIDGMVINLGAFTHTSIAIRDALLATKVKFIEVHISNVYCRETFRQKSYISDIALGSIIGLGKEGYRLAIEYLARTCD